MAPSKASYPGVQRRGDALRIYFNWRGRRVFEPHPAPPTAAGLAAAARDRARIVAEIQHGVFDYAKWFPESERAEAAAGVTFGEQAEKWLTRVRPELEHSTLDGYCKKLNRYWLPHLDHRPIAEITAGELKDIAACITVSGKTYNDSLTPLRGVFESALDDELIAANPARSLKSRRHQAPEPDPLTLDEMRAVLDYLKRKRPEWLAYFGIAFGTGMRTSELIAVRWSDVDLRSSKVLVQRAYVDQRLKSAKTRERRTIELTDFALGHIKAQRPVTSLKGDDPLLLLDPGTGEIINDDKPPRLVWTAALKSCGIRHRPAYNTRHTFATQALMSGAQIAWVSRQLGHASIAMTLKHYAKWLDGEDDRRELTKLNLHFSDLKERVI